MKGPQFLGNRQKNGVKLALHGDVHEMRRQQTPDADWDGWPEWPDPDGGKGRVPYYTIKL
jgi:hypothetical protein